MEEVETSTVLVSSPPEGLADDVTGASSSAPAPSTPPAPPPAAQSGSGKARPKVQVQLEHLRLWLPLYLRKTDATIMHLNR